MFIKYTYKKFPFQISIYNFGDCSLLEILHLLITTEVDMSYRTVYKNGNMIARQQIYNGVSYER